MTKRTFQAFDVETIRSRIIEAGTSQMELDSETAWNVAFHLTDWLDDLQLFYQLCQRPEQFGSDEVNEILMGFLIHAPNHIAAAAKLYCDSPVKDIFEVGATSETEE